MKSSRTEAPLEVVPWFEPSKLKGSWMTSHLPEYEIRGLLSSKLILYSLNVGTDVAVGGLAVIGGTVTASELGSADAVSWLV